MTGRRSCMVAGAIFAIFTAALAPKAEAQTRIYNITLTNLTSTAPNSGQPFSPPVFATHDNTVDLWTLGSAASLGIERIAEAGNRTVLVSDLQPLVGAGVLNLVTPLSSPLPQGGAVTIQIAADAAHPFLSSAFMLGWTNDGFSGQDSIDLFSLTGTTVFDLMGYDAGTEINNERTGFLGALGGGNGRDPENGVITVHTGIRGDVDAPASWNWTNPVARISISVAAPEPSSVGLIALGLFVPAGMLRRRRKA
ncbi:MAG: spondin domain-containing protein [Capsulimonadales bacterium]|nr:spondin domain-containing protein [Capsulimonadales bacterium]